MAKMTKACKGTSYPKSSNVSKRLGSPSKAKKGVTMKKAKSGTSLGMKSVKAGYDKNPGVTRADIIVAAKKEAKSGTKMKKALLGIGIGKEERMARRAERQGNRQMRRSERQSMRMSRDNANPYRRGCKGGNCASRNIGTRIVGFKKGGVKKAQEGKFVGPMSSVGRNADRDISYMQEMRNKRKTQTRIAQAPVRKGASRTPMLGVRSEIRNAADDAGISYSRPKKSYFKKGGKMKKCEYGCK